MKKTFTGSDLLLQEKSLSRIYHEDFFDFRSLFFTEMEFLVRFWKGENNAFVVYVGKEVSTVPLLSELFPKLRFHVYGTKKTSLPNLVYHEEEFDTNLAKGWKNTKALFPVYFICYSLMEKQKLWYEIISPDAALLDFIFSPEHENYLDGCLMKRPFSSSLNTSLVPNKEIRKYTEKYLRKISFHNLVIRKKYIYNGGETYDQAYENFAFTDYITKTQDNRNVSWFREWLESFY